MADEPAVTPERPKPKGGRPTRREASARALLGVDVSGVDPLAVLREILADRSQPGSTRVSAAKALLDHHQHGEGGDPGGDSRVNARAIAMMRRSVN
jgi:hypothetical protein